MAEKFSYIPARLKSAVKGGFVTGAEDVKDDVLGKSQREVNADTYRKGETYSKEQLNNMITTPEQGYLSVTATSETTDVDDVATLIATKYPEGKESADTVYRVGCWDGEQYDTGVYSEYVWDGTQYILVGVKNPGIDDEPTLGSDNLVTSNGVQVSKRLTYQNMHVYENHVMSRYNDEINIQSNNSYNIVIIRLTQPHGYITISGIDKESVKRVVFFNSAAWDDFTSSNVISFQEDVDSVKLAIPDNAEICAFSALKSDYPDGYGEIVVSYDNDIPGIKSDVVKAKDDIVQLESQETFDKYSKIKLFLATINSSGVFSPAPAGSTSYTRAAMRNYIKAPFQIKASSGFKTFVLYKYTLNNDGTLTFVSNSEENTAGRLSVTDTSYVYRINFKKSDNTSILSSELDDIIDEFYNTSPETVVKDADNTWDKSIQSWSNVSMPYDASFHELASGIRLVKGATYTWSMELNAAMDQDSQVNVWLRHIDNTSHDARIVFTAGATSGTTEFVAPATGYYYINYRSLYEGQTDKTVSSMIITVCNVAELKKDVDYLLKNVPKKAYTIGADILRFRPYYSHFLVAERETIATNKIIAPSQSLFDIEVSARLGFTAIELNAHITSDGHYVCFHGTSNKFDGQFELSDDPTGDFADTPLENIAVSSVTLADIQASVRNRAKYAKYRTAPNTLEECLNECRRWGIVPFVTFNAGTFPIIQSIVGDDFIGYIGGPSNISPALRKLTDAMLFVFDNTTDNVQDVLDNCEALGGCVLYDAAKIDSWDEDLVVDYVETMHNHGHFVAGIPNDIPRRGEPSNQKYLRCNYDALCSGWNINKIENGNICNLSADIDFSDFTHNGSVSNGVLTLANGNTITPNFSIPSVFLGGGYLEIKFIGTLNFVMGDNINYTMSSDKYDVRVFSSAFFESVPTFTITSSGSTTITGIQYKASRL